MELAPCNIYLDKCLKCDRDGLFVAEMKSSTKTSAIFVHLTAAVILCLGFSV